MLSPLAEGADRVVAECALRAELPLHVILPMPRPDYVEDFHGDSRSEFERLLDLASQVETLAPQPSRSESYLAVGRYVVDHCDILIAVWNGEPTGGPGGTADTVAYARSERRVLYWIHSSDPTRIERESAP